MTQDSSNEKIDGELNEDVTRDQGAATGTEFDSAPPAMPIQIRIGWAFHGILLPIVCNCLVAPTKSQSSESLNKFSNLLSAECGWPLYPFLIFAIVCLGAVIRNENWAYEKPWVRFGIFSGVIIPCWYMTAPHLGPIANSNFEGDLFVFYLASALVLVTLLVLPILCATIWLSAFHESIKRLTTLRYDEIPNAIKFGVGMIAIVFLAAIFQTGSLIILLYPFFMLLPFMAPIAFLNYLDVSNHVLKRHPLRRRFTITQLMIWVTWLAAFMGAIRTTIDLSAAKCIN